MVQLQNITEIKKVQWPFLARISSTDFTCRGMMSGCISSMELLAAAVFSCCSVAIYKESFQCFNKESAVAYSDLQWSDNMHLIGCNLQCCRYPVGLPGHLDVKRFTVRQDITNILEKQQIPANVMKTNNVL